MIATMRGACLVGVLVIVIVCLTETRAYVSFDQVNPGNSSVSDDDRLKSAGPEQEAKAETEKPKLTRVPLEPRKSRRAIDGSLATVNENDGEKSSRITIKERPIPEDVAPRARPGAKRNHKKMKLAQTQSQKKSKKTKRYIDIAAKQQLVGNQNRSETVRANRYKNEKYYAERKAIMDRYHARHNEIIRKYQQRRSTTTSTTTTAGPFRFNLNNWFVKEAKMKPPIASPSPQVLARTIGVTRSILEAHSHEDLDSSDETTELTTTTTKRAEPSTKRPKTTSTERAREGNCDNLESLDLVYQYNLLLDVQKSTTVATRVEPPTIEGSCIVCIIAYQTSGPPQQVHVSKTSEAVNTKVEGIDSGSVAITMKFYTDSRGGGSC